MTIKIRLRCNTRMAKLIHLKLLVIKRSIIGNGYFFEMQLRDFANKSLTSCYGACLY